MQEDLESDPFVRGRPVVLQSKDGHALWVSQRVLDAMAPIPAHVEGGHIVRDEAGNPTGQYARQIARDLDRLPHDTQVYFWITLKTWFQNPLQLRSNYSNGGLSWSGTRMP